jgi:type IV secretion system protein VirB11
MSQSNNSNNSNKNSYNPDLKNSSVTQNRYLTMIRTAFGPEVLKFMEDDQVIEIMLNPDGKLWVEKLTEGPIFTGTYLPPEQSENIIKLIASFKNNIANQSFPMLSTELPLSSARFQGWLPPVVSQPCFNIRKHGKIILTLEDYENSGTITHTQRALLEKAMLEKKNIVIAGGTSSGKTTFANALLQILNNQKDRVLILEDLPELQVEVPDLVKMTTSETVTMRDLVKGSLRMRPDRIIIGEVRDGAALDLLKAWNTGHPGGLCTLHANSGESTPYRLEDLIQEVAVTVPRSLILNAIDLIIFIQKNKQGQRKVESISHLTGYENGKYLLKAL